MTYVVLVVIAVIVIAALMWTRGRRRMGS